MKSIGLIRKDTLATALMNTCRFYERGSNHIVGVLGPECRAGDIYPARSQPLNAECGKNKQNHNIMERINRMAGMVVSMAACVFLSLMAIIFAAISLSAGIMAIIDKDFFSAICSVAAGLVAWIIWDIRR